MSADVSVLVLGGWPPESPLPSRPASSARRSPCSKQPRSAAPASIAARRPCGRWRGRPGWRVTGPRGPRSAWTPAAGANLPAMVANSDRVARYAHDKKDMAGHLRRAWDRPVRGPWTRRVHRPAHRGRQRSTDPGPRPHRPGRRRAGLAVPSPAPAARSPTRTSRPWPASPAGPRWSAAPTRAARSRPSSPTSAPPSACSRPGPSSCPPPTPASRTSSPPAPLPPRGMNVHTGTLVERLGAGSGAIRVDYRGPGGRAPDRGRRVLRRRLARQPHPSGPGGRRGAPGPPRSPSTGTCAPAWRTSSPSATSTAGRWSCRAPEWKAGSRLPTPFSGPPGRPPTTVVPSGSFTDPEYGRVGLTEAEAAQQHDAIAGIARYDDLLRPVADGRPDGFCKLIADRRDHTILGAHVLGEYSAETVQTVAACMAAGIPLSKSPSSSSRSPPSPKPSAWPRRRSAGPSASEISRRPGAISEPTNDTCGQRAAISWCSAASGDRLGTTDMDITRVGFGAWAAGGSWVAVRGRCFRCVRQAIPLRTPVRRVPRLSGASYRRVACFSGGTQGPSSVRAPHHHASSLAWPTPWRLSR